MPTSTELFELGKAATLRGERQQARTYLEQALEFDQQNDQVLVWLAGVVDEPKGQQIYLARALQANPNSVQAQKGLIWLKERNPELFESAPATVPLTGAMLASWTSASAAGNVAAPAFAAFPAPPASGPVATPIYSSAPMTLPPALDQVPIYSSASMTLPPASGQVATPIYSSAPITMPPVHSDAPQSYYVPGAVAVGRGKRVGCVTAFMIVNTLYFMMTTGSFMWVVRTINSPGVDAQTRQEFQAMNEFFSQNFISLQALVALMMGFTVLYIAGSVGVALRASWGWYIALVVIGLYFPMLLLQMAIGIQAGGGVGLCFMLQGLIVMSIMGFLIYVLLNNRKVFR